MIRLSLPKDPCWVDLPHGVRVFVDDYDGASKSGDIAQPARAGLIDSMRIEADPADLCRGQHPGRRSDAEYTVFKSAGASLEDLAAADLARSQVLS